jgi:hypothetical protein
MLVAEFLVLFFPIIFATFAIVNTVKFLLNERERRLKKEDVAREELAKVLTLNNYWLLTRWIVLHGSYVDDKTLKVVEERRTELYISEHVDC